MKIDDIKKVKLDKGDVVVITVRDPLARTHRTNLQTHLNSIFPDNKSMILVNAELNVVSGDVAAALKVPSDDYSVVRNHCNCHPETCGCYDWKIIDAAGKKISTHYVKTDADDLAGLLNGKIAS